MPEPLEDAETTLAYVIAQAQEGAERLKELRHVAYAVLRTPGTHDLRPDMLRQLEVAVQAHARYLDVLREALYLDLWERCDG